VFASAPILARRLWTQTTRLHPFSGIVKKVLVDITGEAVEDKAAKMRMYLSRQ
jgi:hypothetical protein